MDRKRNIAGAFVLTLGVLVAAVLAAPDARAVGPKPFSFQVYQPDGTPVTVREVMLHGRVVMENEHGYLVAYDRQTAEYRYAEEGFDGKMMASDVPAHLSPPAGLAVEKGWRPRKSSSGHSMPHLEPIRRSGDPAKVGDDVAPALQGTGKILFVLVDFAEDSGVVQHQATAAQFTNQFFSSGTYPTGSMRDYYQEVSYGHWNIEGTVHDWTTAPGTYDYYCNDQQGHGAYPQNSQGLVVDVCNAIDAQVDFSQYDGDGDGYVDAVIIVYEGVAIARSDLFWPHAWGLYGNSIELDGVTINRFALVNELNQVGQDSYEAETIGVSCHEYGHILGAPDLYDYDDGSSTATDFNSYPVRNWCLMASGNYSLADGGEPGSGPNHPCALVRSLFFGWIVAQEVTLSGTLELQEVETHAQAAKIVLDPDFPDEYLLVENRHAGSGAIFDHNSGSVEMDSGWLIMHVDEELPWSRSGRFNNGQPLQPYYRAQVVDPGQWESFGGPMNVFRGDAAFSAEDDQTELSPNTMPFNTDLNDGTLTGARITGVGPSGATVTGQVFLPWAPASSCRILRIDGGQDVDGDGSGDGLFLVSSSQNAAWQRPMTVLLENPTDAARTVTVTATHLPAGWGIGNPGGATQEVTIPARSELGFVYWLTAPTDPGSGDYTVQINDAGTLDEMSFTVRAENHILLSPSRTGGYLHLGPPEDPAGFDIHLLGHELSGDVVDIEIPGVTLTLDSVLDMGDGHYRFQVQTGAFPAGGLYDLKISVNGETTVQQNLLLVQVGSDPLLGFDPVNLVSPYRYTRSINIRSYNTSGTVGLAASLRFDPTRVQVVSCREGDYFNSNETVATTFTRSIDNLTGLVRFEVNRDNGTGVSGEAGDVIVLEVVAQGLGPDALVLENSVATSVGGVTDSVDLMGPANLQAVSVEYASEMGFSPRSLRAEVGETFSVDIVVAGAVDVSGFAGEVGYDPAMLSLVGVTEGPALNGGVPSSTVFTYSHSEATGRILLGLSRILGTQPGVTIMDGSPIVTLTFEVVGPGTGRLDILDPGLMRPDGLTQVPTEAFPARVEVPFPPVQEAILAFSADQYGAFQPSEEFQVTATLAEVEGVSAYGFDLVYDPDQLELTSVTKAGFLEQNGATTYLAWSETDPGRVIVGETILGDPGQGASATGAEDICVFHFQALATGTTLLNFLDYDVFAAAEHEDIEVRVRPCLVVIQEADEPFGISGIFPNPFNPQANILFTVDRQEMVDVGVFDISGRRVATLLRETLEPGLHRVLWDGKVSNGSPAATGVYFLRVAGSSTVATERMTLLK